MKKVVSLCCVFALMLSLLCSCGGSRVKEAIENNNNSGFGDIASNPNAFAQMEPEQNNRPSEPQSSKGDTESKPTVSNQIENQPVRGSSPAWETVEESFEQIGDPVDNKWLLKAVIENTGDSVLYVGSATADVETVSGSLVGKMEYLSFYPSYIYPGEKAYLSEYKSFDEYTGTESLQETMRVKVETATSTPRRYPVSDVELRPGDYGKLSVIGRVENDTGEGESSLKLSMIFMSNGKFAFSNATYMSDTIDAGTKVSFEERVYPSWYDLESSGITDVVVYATPMFELNW